jgi:hypothetical protein
MCPEEKIRLRKRVAPIVKGEKSMAGESVIGGSARRRAPSLLLRRVVVISGNSCP